MSEPGDRFLIQRIDRDEYLFLAHYACAGQRFVDRIWGPVETAGRFNERTALAIMRQVGDGDGQTALRLAARRT